MAKKKKADIVTDAFANLSRQWLLSTPVSEMTDEEAVGAWLQLDMIAAIAKGRKEELKARYMGVLEKTGEENDRGSFSMDVDGSTIVRERRQASLPDPELVKKLLTDRGLDISEAFDEQRSWELSPSKLKFLVECGKLPAQEIEDSRKVTWAFKVKPGAALKSVVDKTKKALLKKKS